ncbi:glucan 1,4-beta-glucosidase [Marinomonas sp. MED121]|uniref:glycoside hydrolase family 3 protein n=1 Tax=Marinomonas sp. MED121 TaxID=314277 RepID=UPI000068FB1F|nr:glycoside hydrolase family 3 protein [Marinomonas sp. MED121]EAQ65103.1 glucan 1,4-beta-glucosidase [Marinomonas sp. MED121]
MTIQYYQDWPNLADFNTKDASMEKEIEDLLAKMSLAEKVGQMIQPELRSITPAEFEQYKFGSLLNGGGAWPDNNKHASALAWAKKADEYWQATEAAYQGRGFRIPFIWGTDAVHGHNNVLGATIFPHNIGLGAMGDTDLIEKIAAITAKEVRATGIEWTFSPSVSTPRHYGWGRVYEGYSEDPEVVEAYAKAMVQGLQGENHALNAQHVISTAKHWIGDGGTFGGVDRGQNFYSEEALMNLHGQGYFSAIKAGVQSIMVSFNSWDNPNNYQHQIGQENALKNDQEQTYNYKIHGSHYLISEVLKGKIGFDGVVISDWNGHAEVSLANNGNANFVVNAGMDILMVPEKEDWLAVYDNLLTGAETGEVPLARIDDAVRRILRMKKRAHLWSLSSPSSRKFSGDQSLIGHADHKAVAREAVSKSLVLLKNNQKLLPLNRTKVAVLGAASDSFGPQLGGWSMTWQGSETSASDFPDTHTFLSATQAYLGHENVLDHLDTKVKRQDVEQVIMVFGEAPYAEMLGDLQDFESLDQIALGAQGDLARLKQYKALGYQVTTVLYSGRPIYINEILNYSDAVIAAWLPGSMIEGAFDVIFKNAEGQVNRDFSGKLSFSWPKQKFAKNVNRSNRKLAIKALGVTEDSEEKILFPYGYGLDYRQDTPVMPEVELDKVSPLDIEQVEEVRLFGADSLRNMSFEIEQQENRQVISRNSFTQLDKILLEPINYQHQQDAIKIEAQTGAEASIELKQLASLNLSDRDLLIDVKCQTKPSQVSFYIGDDEVFGGHDWLESLEIGDWSQIRFSGANKLGSLLLSMKIHGKISLSIGNIRAVKSGF